MNHTQSRIRVPIRNLLFLLMLSPLSLFGQDMTSAEDSDPRATRILNDLRAKYEGYPLLQVEFDFILEQPEAPKEVQKGNLVRQDDRFRVKLGNQTILSDGEAYYLILHNNKEVQINDLPDPEEMTVLSPQTLFSFYESGEFVYALINELSEGGRVIQQIEFKPLDSGSEYRKIRFEIDKGKKQPIQVIAFSKDGGRYTIRFTSLKRGEPKDPGFFAFSEDEYPNYYVEDLRQ
jgi:outer membrane lipoprotein-sorting protein